MAEVLGAGAAGLQLFETAIVVFKHINRAYRRKKGIANLLEKYRKVLIKTRELAATVEEEKLLQGPKVSEILAELRELDNQLCKWLDNVDPHDRNSLRQVVDQLVRGSKDLKDLDIIMKDLDRVKVNFSLIVDMHLVKVTHTIKEAVVTDRSECVTVSQKPKKNCNTTTRVKASMPTQHRVNTEMSDSGISSMSSEDDDTSSDDSSEGSSEGSVANDSTFIPPQAAKSREIKIEGNTAQLGGMMINSAVGKKDLWKDVQKLWITDNVCEQFGTMINYRIDSVGLDLAAKQMEMQMELARKERAEKVEEVRAQMLWEKQNGFQ